MTEEEFNRKIDELGFYYESIKDKVYAHFPADQPAMKALLNDLMYMRNLGAEALQEAKKNS